MDAIAGRKEEVAFLEGLLSKSRSEFVAVSQFTNNERMCFTV